MLVIAIYNLYFHQLRRFPGPKLWAAFRFPYVLCLQRGELHARLKAMHKSYGPIVRVAPNELSFTDVRAWKDIYGSRQGHAPFQRNRTWFAKPTPDEPNSIMGFDEPDHARFRKTLVHAFSEKALKDQSPMIESYVTLLVNKLKEKGNAVVDLVEWLNYCTFDISGDLSFGESFDCLQHGRPHPWVEISYTFGKGLALVASVNYYAPLNKILGYVLPQKIRQRMLDHREISREKVHKRLDLALDRPDFITPITRANKEQDGKAFSTKEIELNAAILIFAGSETTASGLSGIIRMLLQNPKAMAKLVQEVRSSFQEEAEITIASVSRLEYLNAAIEEGLRLCPPATIGVPRVVPQGGDTVCGEWLPANVSYFLLSISFQAFFRGLGDVHAPLCMRGTRVDLHGLRRHLLPSINSRLTARQRALLVLTTSRLSDLCLPTNLKSSRMTRSRRSNHLASAGIVALGRHWPTLRCA